jgi:hypothetical protein
MRFMVIVKASKESEAGQLPTEQELTEMGNFNDELIKAGVMLAGEGLADLSEGSAFVVDFAEEPPVVTDGPYGETHELFNGFWIVQVASKEEAIAWLERAPFRNGEEVEIRQVFEASDFGENFAPDQVAKEEAWRKDSGYAERK